MGGGTARQPDAAPLSRCLRPRLRPGRAAAVREQLAELGRSLEASGVDPSPAGLRVDDATDPLARFLGSVMDVSPFLREAMLREPKRLVRLLGSDPARALRNLLARTRRAWQGGDRDRTMRALRLARQELALLTALADLGGVWDVDRVTGALTAFAEAATMAACRLLLSEAAEAGRLTLADPARPEVGCGWIVLAMGKFGGRELNYSSDIDLIVLYDEAVAPVAGEHDAADVFVRLTRHLAAMLGEHTGDGYVFRTDLRLRPDPGSTNVALSTEAALQYYESFGQNWERSAMIKARAVAGDLAAAEAFLAELQPYVWRRYLDFAAIADIHAIKRQIHDHRGFGDIAVAGHNVKLGAGGIREIEFFVQTQQLIAGGRHTELRGRRTTDMLAALAGGGWIDPAAARQMSEAYAYLRVVEHCIQMVADQQTHALPEDEDALAAIGRMAGHRSLAAFRKRLRATLETVRRHYTALFEEEVSLAGAAGNLVFTGDDDDPGTLRTLAALGFQRPEEVSDVVRGWHYGRYPATRSPSARERLTTFVPLLLDALATAERPDEAFGAFDRFLSRMPAGVQLFSLLQSNRGLLSLVLLILGAAPRLADTIVQRAHVLDALTEPAFFGRLPDRKTLEERLKASLRQARGYEDVLDRARIFVHEQSLLIGVRVLAGTVGVARIGHAYSDLADVVVAALMEHVRAAFEAEHGRMKGGRVALLALGRLGGREMTAASDLDLIMLYDYAGGASESNGNRPLGGTQYYGRLTQRLVAALSSPTAEGIAYEVDFRLRPSGKSGPLATHIDSFALYQQESAWTWEHMALTRARAIFGDRKLVERTEREIDAALAKRRDRKKTLADIVEMRGMVEEAKGEGGVWDIKQTPGGTVDIEFIVQMLQLLHGARHPDLASTETAVALEAAVAARVLKRADAEVLARALALYQSLMQILRLSVSGPVEADDIPRELKARLALAVGLPDFATLDRHLRDEQKAVRDIFVRLVGTPKV